MRLRTCYSLLPWLLLAAVVAGGVKLWRGPHHVIDRSSSNPQTEDEYTYYMGWDGTEVLDRVRVTRYLDYENKRQLVHMFLYRRGEKLPVWRMIQTSSNIQPLEQSSNEVQLTKDELEQIKHITKQESAIIKISRGMIPGSCRVQISIKC